MCLTFFFGRRGSSNKFIILGLEIETCWTLAAFSVSGIEKSGAAASSSSSSSNPPQKHISRPPLFSLPPSCLSLPRSPPQICVLTSQERGGKVILISDSCLISLFGRSYIARPIRSQDISGGMNYSPQSDWAFELNFWQSGGYICACEIVVIVFLSF